VCGLTVNSSSALLSFVETVFRWTINLNELSVSFTCKWADFRVDYAISQLFRIYILCLC